MASAALEGGEQDDKADGFGFTHTWEDYDDGDMGDDD